MRDHSGLLVSLQAGIAELTTSEKWRQYLDVQSRFHSYSPSNSILILMQNPNATRVAGYKTWEALDHQVMAKESALRILAPMRYKKDDVREGEDAREIRGFKLVPVFDISQTEGPDLPDVVNKLEGLAPEGVFERLTEFAHNIGFRVERPESLDSGANGDTTHSSGLIRVVSANSEAQQAKTLAHEIGHALLHDPESVPTKDLTRGLKELEAESTAYVICTALGIDTSDYSFGYVLGWTGGTPDAIEGIKASAGRIQRAATAVLKTFEMEEPTAEVTNELGVEMGPPELVADITAEVDRESGHDRDEVQTDIDQPTEDSTETENIDVVTDRSFDDEQMRKYRPLSAAELEALDTPTLTNREVEIGR